MSLDIDVREMVVKFGSVVAVDDVDLAVERGELHGLIGPNGAGKSTLVNAISGRVRSTSSHAVVAGHAVQGRRAAWLRRHGISRSFQTTSIFATLTVGEQLALAARRLGDARLGDLVDELALAPFLDRVAGEISYGDQRRVDLALALVGSPRVLLLDEPAAGLTAAETDSVLQMVKKMATDRGLTVLLVEHDVNAVFTYSDRITVLDRGAVLAVGAPEQVRRDDRVIRAYLGTMA